MKIKWVCVQPLNGGMPLGFEKELKTKPEFVISNNDIYDNYYINYINNVKKENIPIIKTDWNLTEFKDNGKEIFDKLNKNIDIVCAVPICSGLSMLNYQNDKNSKYCRGKEDNIQNQNMYNVTDFVLSKIKPKVYVFENAPALFTNLGKAVKNKLYNIAQKYNYSITIELVNTINHGIPQNRKRTFMYFWNSDYAYEVFYEHQYTPKIVEFFDNFISKDATQQDEFYEKENNFDIMYYYVKDKLCKKGETIQQFAKRLFGDKIITVLNIIEKLDKFDDLIEYIKNSNLTEEEKNKYVEKIRYVQNKIKFGKGYWNFSNIFSTTDKYYNALITKNVPYIFHPTKYRALTKRELISLMGLPNDYEIKENKSKFLIVLTRSVPVNTAMHAAKNCKLYIERKLKRSNTKILFCNNIKNGKIRKNSKLF